MSVTIRTAKRRGPPSAETRERLKAGQQRRMDEGRHNFNKGRIVPEDIRRAVSTAQIGRKQSKETIDKRMMATKATVEKRGPFQYSQESRLKMRLAGLGRKQSAETIEKRFASRKGYRHSEATRIKISLANRTDVRKPDDSKQGRRTVEYRLWREAVMKRDDWTCQKYKIRGCILHPHHILNFATHPILRFEVTNGIMLSVKAHREFHRIYGKKNNTREQLIEFLQDGK